MLTYYSFVITYYFIINAIIKDYHYYYKDYQFNYLTCFRNRKGCNNSLYSITSSNILDCD